MAGVVTIVTSTMALGTPAPPQRVNTLTGSSLPASRAKSMADPPAFPCGEEPKRSEAGLDVGEVDPPPVGNRHVTDPTVLLS